MEVKMEKQETEFEKYNSFCKKKGIKPCRYESLMLFVGGAN